MREHETDSRAPADKTNLSALPKWLGLALLASLCINFLAIGVFAAMFWQRGPAPGAGTGPGGYGPAGTSPGGTSAPGYAGMPQDQSRTFIRHGGGQGGLGLGRGPLNPHMLMYAVPEKADAIRETLQARADGMRTLREKAFAARSAAGAALADKNYTDSKFAAALKSVHDADNALEAYVLETVKASVARLTPEERRRAGEADLSGGRGMGNGMGGRMRGRMGGYGPQQP